MRSPNIAGHTIRARQFRSAKRISVISKLFKTCKSSGPKTPQGKSAVAKFKRDVELHLTGRETEPWELLYFKVHKSQLPVIEQALETAGLMLRTNKSRGYCQEMICADFLAGA